jgi:DNA-binding MarR family transcriptional regulator
MQISITFNYAVLFDGNNVDHLPYREKAQELFELIKDCQNMKGWAFFRLSWLAKRLAVTKRYIQKLIKVLRDACLIEVRRREQNFYRVNPLLEQAERKGKIKTTPATKPSAPINERAMRDKATTEIGKVEPSVQPMVNETEARAVIEAYEASKLANPVNINESLAIIEEEIAGEIDEITAVIQEAAKEVKKETRYQRPKEIRTYLDRVKTKLTQWQIDVPQRLLRDLVLQIWKNWTY